jgi:hypothetical protein
MIHEDQIREIFLRLLIAVSSFGESLRRVLLTALAEAVFKHTFF